MGNGYRDVAEHYRGMILTGQLVPNQLLPSVRDVADAFDVSQKTAHRGLQQLVLTGLVRPTPRGFEITDLAASTTTLRVPIDGVRRRGFLPVDGEIKDIDFAGMAATPAAIAAMFGIEDGTDSALRQGRIVRDGRVAARTESWFPAKWAERVPELLVAASTEPGSVARIEAIIGHPTEVTYDRTEVDVADDDLAKFFKIPVNDPIMVRTTYRHDGSDVVEYGRMFTARHVAIEHEYRRIKV